jgi:hypothetical protein
MAESNPFLINIPAVFRVVAVREVDGVDVAAPLDNCVRLWGRVGVTSKGGVDTEIFAPAGGRAYPTNGADFIYPD